MDENTKRTLKCIVVDDEPLAREGLSKYINEIDFLDLVETATNPVELSRILEDQSADLLFMDVQMPLMSGMDFMRISQSLPMVIITTAHPMYAVESYEMDVVDYLLKPITFNRFFKAVTKAKEHYKAFNKIEIGNQESEDGEFVFIKCEHKYEKIFLNKIRYIEAMQNYVHIYTDDKKYTTLMFLKSIEHALPEDQFLRIHRSFVVALSKVDQIDSGEVLIGEKRIPISRSIRRDVQDKILGNHLLR